MFDDFEEPFDDRRVDSAWVVEAEIGHCEGETDYYILTVDPTYTYYIYNDTLDTYDTITSPAFYKIPAKTKILLGQASEATAMLEETSADSQLESGKTFFIFDDLYLKDGNKVSFELLMQVPDTIAYIYTYSADSTITDITPYSTADKMKDHVIYNPNIKLFISEWNLNSIDWRTGLFAGGFLNMCEARDVVAMGAAALFIRRTDAPDWNNAFINFDYKDLFKAPNCQVTELWYDHFSKYRLAYSGETGNVSVSTTMSENGADVIVKVVNPTDHFVQFRHDLELKLNTFLDEFFKLGGDFFKVRFVRFVGNRHFKLLLITL